MKEVPSRKLEKQIGQWSSSSASLQGSCVDASSLVDLCHADLRQVPVASELE